MTIALNLNGAMIKGSRNTGYGSYFEALGHWHNYETLIALT
jgi:hypothetical protein